MLRFIEDGIVPFNVIRMALDQSQTISVNTSPKTMSWIEDILSSLDKQGYSLAHISNDTQDTFLLETDDAKLPDAIISTNVASSAKLMLQFGYLNGQRPLIVLIADPFAQPIPDNCADVVLPPSAFYVAHQLETLLQLKKENSRLLEQCRQLEHEILDLQESLARQNRLVDGIEVIKNAIVRNVSHELKTPLLQVKSAVALLAEDVKDEKLINYAKGATARLETLVKNITLLGSSLDMNAGPVVIRDAVEYAKRNLGRIWEHVDSRDRIKTEIEDDLPPVLADKQGLSTVLQLLMDNALKFSKDDVVVSVRKIETNHVEIRITDKGIGIAENQLEAIFQTFYQVDSSSTRRYGGAGVGLAIVQLILDLHQTRIWVESEVGKGSTFAFTLPIVDL